jgi:hypothetical protein
VYPQPQHKKLKAAAHLAPVAQPAHTKPVAAERLGVRSTHTADIRAMAIETIQAVAHTVHTNGTMAAKVELVATAAGEASGHKATSVGTPMKAIVESLTKREITEIIRGLGYQAIPKADEDFGELIFSSNEGIRWNVYLGHTGPFFQEILITLFSWTTHDPVRFVNTWNTNNFVTASAPGNENTVVPESDGTFLVTFETRINFDGGISVEHIRRRMSEWIHAVQGIAKLDDFVFLRPIAANKK